MTREEAVKQVGRIFKGVADAVTNGDLDDDSQAAAFVCTGLLKLLSEALFPGDEAGQTEFIRQCNEQVRKATP